MNLATFISSAPTQTYGALGQPETADNEAWQAYFEGLRASTVASWNRTRAAYLALKSVREALGLPFIVAGGEGAPGGALTEQQDQLFLEQGATSIMLTQILDDALDGKRKIIYLKDKKDFGIEGLDTDTTAIEVISGRARIVDKDTRQPIPVTGEISTLGIAPIVWAIAGVATIAAIAATYLINEDNNETARTLAEEKTKQTLAEKQAELVISGKATPEEAKKMTDAIYVGAKELELAKGEVIKQKGESNIQSAVRTVLWGAAGLGAIYLLVRLLPPLLVARV